jgi:hypothetical protein
VRLCEGDAGHAAVVEREGEQREGGVRWEPHGFGAVRGDGAFKVVGGS